MVKGTTLLENFQKKWWHFPGIFFEIVKIFGIWADFKLYFSSEIPPYVANRFWLFTNM